MTTQCSAACAPPKGRGFGGERHRHRHQRGGYERVSQVQRHRLPRLPAAKPGRTRLQEHPDAHELVVNDAEPAKFTEVTDVVLITRDNFKAELQKKRAAKCYTLDTQAGMAGASCRLTESSHESSSISGFCGISKGVSRRPGAARTSPSPARGHGTRPMGENRAGKSPAQDPERFSGATAGW